MTWLDVRAESEFRLAGSTRNLPPTTAIDETRQYLRRVAGFLNRDQMSELLGEVGEIYRLSILDRFRTSTDPAGRPWKKLSQATINLKQRGIVGKGGKLHRPPAVASVTPKGFSSIPAGPNKQLIWTGRMINAIRIVKDTRRSNVNIGLSSKQIPYALIQHVGDATRNIPSRRFLGYNNRTNAEALRAIRAYMLLKISSQSK